MHSWNIFNAWMNHEETWIHKIHHGPNLGETTTFPLIIFFMPGHEANTQMSFCFACHSRNSSSHNFGGP
jgi:hypothetical protein